MKAIGLCLLAGGLIVMSLVLAACNGASAAEPALSDEELAALQAQLDETGGLNVDTLAVAEAVAGFAVAVPSFMPEGFSRGENIIITKRGAGLPEDMKPPNQPITVETFYFLEGDDEGMIIIDQTPAEMGLGGGQPAELCGLQVERNYTEADAQVGARLSLLVRQDGFTYILTAILGGPLNEEAVEQIFCSLLD
jgi:hypothetical protein